MRMGGIASDAGDRVGENNWSAPPATLACARYPQLGALAAAALPACPELDCIRDRLSTGTIAAAELRAAEVGVGADRALIATDVISEEAYLAALATREGLKFEPLHDLRRDAIPRSDDELLDAAAYGMLPVIIDGRPQYVIAPNRFAARGLLACTRAGGNLAGAIRVTTAERLHKFVARLASEKIAHRATHALHDARPDLSAAGQKRRSIALTILPIFLLFTILTAPVAFKTFGLAVGAAFLAWSALRIISPLLAREPYIAPQTFRDADLPVYTIIVALYREAAAVKDLVAALRRLDYPKEKLDIKFVLEADDRDTRTRLELMHLGAPFELVIAPPGGPRTKPKALNAALPFARGAFVAVFDAEDCPDPDQLRRALEAFAAGDERLACAQARLTIDNTADTWLTRLFSAEYAGLFDVFLPSLAALRLPLPLGGSSNHFRAEVLRRVGAWDPFNVTEDADLGMRLARFGYRTTVIASSTYEEAPARLQPWLRQRTRWFKGWLQTWLVHMRAPRKLLRELGPSGFLVFQLLAGGSMLAALVHPFFLFAFLGVIIATKGNFAGAEFYLAVLLIGYFTSAALGVVGLCRRNLLHCAWSLVLIPAYWLLLSLAAWRALLQWQRDPYRWEKTEHGLARSSRLQDQYAGLNNEVRNTAAARPPRPRAGA